MMRGIVGLVSVFVVAALLSKDAKAQCRGGGGGRSGGRGVPSQNFGGSIQTGGFNQNPQFSQPGLWQPGLWQPGLWQQAAMQQSYAQQLQLQRAILVQQQYSLQKAHEREISRQRRLAAANARREKEAKRRAEQQPGDLAAAANSK